MRHSIGVSRGLRRFCCNRNGAFPMAKIKTSWRNAFRIRDEFDLAVMRIHGEALRNLERKRYENVCSSANADRTPR